MTKEPETQTDSDPPEAYADMPKVTYRVPSRFKRRLKIAAAAHGRTETSIIVEAVEAWMKANPNPA